MKLKEVFHRAILGTYSRMIQFQKSHQEDQFLDKEEYQSSLQNYQTTLDTLLVLYDTEEPLTDSTIDSIIQTLLEEECK